MDKAVLVTTGNGMFGSALVNELAGDPRVAVRAMVRHEPENPASASNVSYVTGDLDDPASLARAVEGVTHVFLVSPMDEHVATRETNVIDAAAASYSRPHVLKIHGAVNHRGDRLGSMHEQVIAHLKATGLTWTLVSPNSIMETSFNWLPETIKFDTIFGMSGHGRVGFVALEDVARAAAAVIRSNKGAGDNLLLTGPAALDMYEVAKAFRQALGRDIHYRDMPEDQFGAMLLDWGAFPSQEALELGALCHFRAWGRGDADLVTDTCLRITGREPMTVAEWIDKHVDRFSAPQSDADRRAAAEIAARFA